MGRLGNWNCINSAFWGLFLMVSFSGVAQESQYTNELGIDVSKAILYNSVIVEPRFIARKNKKIILGELGFVKMTRKTTLAKFDFSQVGFYYKLGFGRVLNPNLRFGLNLIGSHYSNTHYFVIKSTFFENFEGLQRFGWRFSLASELYADIILFHQGQVMITSTWRMCVNFNPKDASMGFYYLPGIGRYTLAQVVTGGVNFGVSYLFNLPKKNKPETL